MITYANFQQSVAALLLARPGEKIRISLQQFRSAGIATFEDFEAWTFKHGLQSRSLGTGFLIWKEPYAPVLPLAEPEKDPVDSPFNPSPNLLT